MYYTGIYPAYQPGIGKEVWVASKVSAGYLLSLIGEVSAHLLALAKEEWATSITLKVQRCYGNSILKAVRLVVPSVPCIRCTVVQDFRFSPLESCPSCNR